MPMSPLLLRPIASGVHPEAAAWRTAVVANGGSVSASTVKAVSTFCAAIDAAGIRDRFFRLSLMCGNSDASLIAPRVPLYRGPSRTGTQYGNTLDTNNNFVQGDYAETGASGGLVGNGSSKRLDTGLPGDATSYGDRHLSAYECAKSANAFKVTIGVRQSTFVKPFELSIGSTASLYQFRSSDDLTAATHAGYTGTGAHMLGVHPSSNTGVLYKNGVSVGTKSFSSLTSPNSGNLFVFAGNFGGTASDISPVRLGSYSAGLAMTATQALDFYNAMQAFQTALGRNV